MKKMFALSFIVFFSLIKAKTQEMSDIKSAVSFIYIQDSLGNKTPNGTCFFVGVPSKLDSSSTFSYLVTAKHVLQKKGGNFHSEIFIRMNTIDSSRFTYVPIYLKFPKKNVYFHPDPGVDLAIIPYAPPKDDYIFKILGPSFISDRGSFQKLQIKEGIETFFTGLFTPFTGEEKIHPIVRFGRVALIPDEKIEWIGMKREMLLVETSSFGGNSGAPVYFKIPVPNTFPVSYRLVLGGILNGTYRDLAEIKIIKTSSQTPVVPYNNGITGITPVYLLRDILFSNELVSLRN